MAIALQTTLPQSYGLSRQVQPVLGSKTDSSNFKSSQSTDLQIIPSVETIGTKTISDNFEPLDNGGYKRTRVFEQGDGRVFSRQEEINFKKNSVQKTVIQQNPSGSTTRYEDILDRKTDGNFQRTQRFLSESGEVSTQITNNYKTNDPFILTRGQSGLPQYDTGYSSLRGTRLDLTA